MILFHLPSKIKSVLEMLMRTTEYMSHSTQSTAW